MRAPRAEPSPEIIDFAIERKGPGRTLDDNASVSAPLRATRNPAKTGRKRKLVGDPGHARRGRPDGETSRSIANVVSAQEMALAETRVELAGMRAQMAELEAERG